MAAPAQVDARGAVEQILDQVVLPSGVVLKRLAADTDWEGHPAWRIVYLVQSEPPYSNHLLDSLTDLAHAVEEKVLSLHDGHWPYVSFKGERDESAG